MSEKTNGESEWGKGGGRGESQVCIKNLWRDAVT